VAAAREAGDAYTKAIVDDFSKQKAEMEKAGVKFSEVDLGPFVSRAAVIAREFEQQGQWTAGLFDKVQTLN
jgi:TRAP-type C4-dicarboxylate transport system substrate-binding protein